MQPCARRWNKRGKQSGDAEPNLVTGSLMVGAKKSSRESSALRPPARSNLSPRSSKKIFSGFERELKLAEKNERMVSHGKERSYDA